MRSRRLPGGECLLVEAPAVSSHRAVVVLGLLICRCCMVEGGPHSVSHGIQVVGVCPHCLAISFMIVACVSLPWSRPPRTTPAFLPDDASFLSAVPRRLATWFIHSSFFNSTSPYTRRSHKCLNVFASPSDTIVVYRNP